MSHGLNFFRIQNPFPAHRKPNNARTDRLATSNSGINSGIESGVSCNEAGSETARAGQALKRMVDDLTYCVTKVTEGAAGSIYTQYSYAFPKDNQTAIFTFSIRYVQCGGYSNPKKTECENLRTAFDLDGVMDRIA